MKKRNWILNALCVFLFFVCSFVFVGCKKDEIANFEVKMTNTNFVVSENTITTKYGKNCQLSLADFEITVTFKNDKTKVLSLTDAESLGFTFSSNIPEDEKTPVGAYSLTIANSKLKKTKTFNLVVEEEVASFEAEMINTDYSVSEGTISTEYGEKCDFSLSDFRITATFTNGTSRVLTLAEAESFGFEISSTVPADSKTPAGTYSLTVENSNLTQTKTFSLVVEKIVLDLSDITWSNGTFTYDKTAKSVEITNLPTGVNVSYENNEKTLAGDFKAVATFTLTDTVNFSGLSAETSSFNWKIEKADFVLPVENLLLKNYVYDGELKDIELVDEQKTLFSNSQINVNFHLSVIDDNYYDYKVRDAGVYKVEASFKYNGDDSSCYNPIPKKQINLTVSPKEYTPTVSLNINEFDYDSTLKTVHVSTNPETFDSSIVEVGLVSGNKQSSAGTYTAVVNFKLKNNNYVLTNTSVELPWEIKPAKLTVTVNMTKTTIEYGETTDGIGDVEFVGLKGDDSIAFTLRYGKYIDEQFVEYLPGKEFGSVGAYVVEPVGVSSISNYDIDVEQKTFSVTKKQLSGLNVVLKQNEFVIDSSRNMRYVPFSLDNFDGILSGDSVGVKIYYLKGEGQAPMSGMPYGLYFNDWQAQGDMCVVFDEDNADSSNYTFLTGSSSGRAFLSFKVEVGEEKTISVQSDKPAYLHITETLQAGDSLKYFINKTNSSSSFKIFDENFVQMNYSNGFTLENTTASAKTFTVFVEVNTSTSSGVSTDICFYNHKVTCMKNEFESTVVFAKHGFAVELPTYPDPAIDTEFVGWSEDVNLESKFEDETPVNEDITLYAKFRQKEAFSIFEYIFRNDGNLVLKGLKGSMKDLVEDVVIPEGFDVIGSSSFQYNSKIKSVTFPNSLKEIEIYSFRSCSNLTTINFGTGLKKIGEGAFSYCTSIVSCSIPDSVETIDAAIFMDCSNLENVTIGTGLKTLINGTFVSTKIETIVIPDNIEELRGYVFTSCSSLKTIFIGNGLKKITDKAFNDCSGIEEIYYKGSSEDWEKITIYDYEKELFKNVRIYFYSETTPTENGWFWKYDTNGNVVTEYSHVNHVYDDNCDKTCSLCDNIRTTPHDDPDGDGMCESCKTIFETSGLAYSFDQTTESYIVTGIGSSSAKYIKIPATYDGENGSHPVTAIGNNAFADDETKNLGIKVVYLPNSILSIGENAFKDCDELTSLDIPANVTSIGKYAFSGTGIVSIRIPEGVTVLKEGLFSKSKLATICVHKNVKTIEADAFSNCKELTCTFFEGSKNEWNAISITDQGSGNHMLGESICYYSATEEKVSGERYWYYNDDNQPAFWS